MPNLSSHIQTFSVYDAPFAGIDLIFDSLDGFFQNKSPGAQIWFGTGQWDLITGPTLNDYIEMGKRDLLPIYDYTWTKRRQLRFRLYSQIFDDPSGEYQIGTGSVLGMFHGFGLKFTPTKIIGWAGNAGDHSEVDLITDIEIGTESIHLYEILFFPGNGVYFYVDGVLMGTVTEHLPQATFYSEYVFDIYMFNNTNGIQCVFAFSRFQSSQDR